LGNVGIGAHFLFWYSSFTLTGTQIPLFSVEDGLNRPETKERVLHIPTHGETASKIKESN
jgi:hypothetical protein